MKTGRFAFAARNFDVTRPLGGGDRWLGCGRWPVVIEDSDATKAEESGKIWLTFRSEGDAMYRKGIFVLTRDGSAFSSDMRQLLGATLPDVDAQRAFRDLIQLEAVSARLLESFRGMKVLLELRDGEGYRIEFDSESSEYVALNEAGVVLATDREVGTLNARLKAEGHRRSFREIQSIEVLDEHSKTTNLAAFGAVVASIQKSQETEGDPAANQFAGYKGPSSR